MYRKRGFAHRPTQCRCSEGERERGRDKALRGLGRENEERGWGKQGRVKAAKGEWVA